MIAYIYRLLLRAWESPTLNSWASFGIRAFGFLLLLPLILNEFSTEEIALWLLFATVINLQMLLDAGFSPTFSRIIAFAMGGSQTIPDLREPDSKPGNGMKNWDFIGDIVSTMRHVYLFLGLSWVLILIFIITWFAVSLINQIDNPLFGWFSWVIVVITSGVKLYGTQYSSFIFGINRIALLRRWEAIVWMCMLPVAAVVIVQGGGILGVVAVTQLFVLINVWINRYLANRAEIFQYKNLSKNKFKNEIFYKVLSLAWRSGIGILMTAGLVQLTGIVYTQYGSPGEVATYLLALNLIRAIMQFSQAPFYSKIPTLAKLRSEGDIERQKLLAERGMRLSYWSLIIGLIGVGVSGESALILIQSNAEFPDIYLWSLLALSAFLERFGAMHLQLYSTTNHILWHVANGVTGLIYLVCVIPLFHWFGVYAFPLSQIISYILFYDWFCACRSYNAFQIDIIPFELRTSFLPLLILIAFSVSATTEIRL